MYFVSLLKYKNYVFRCTIFFWGGGNYFTVVQPQICKLYYAVKDLTPNVIYMLYCYNLLWFFYWFIYPVSL